MSANAWRLGPGEVLDYRFEFGAWMASGDSIQSHAVEVPAGLTLVDSAVDGADVVAWVSGAVEGEVYDVTAVVTTIQARTARRTRRVLGVRKRV
jgi:hypothetical protein